MSEGKPFEQWLWSNKNFAGCILAIGGPVLAVSGLVAPPIALALIPVLYAAGALAAPGNKKVDLAGNVDAKNVTQSLNTIRKAVKGKVAASLREKLKEVFKPRTGALYSDAIAILPALDDIKLDDERPTLVILEQPADKGAYVWRN